MQNFSEISEGGAVVHSSVCMCDDSTITTTTNTTHTSHTSTTTYKDSEMANRGGGGGSIGGNKSKDIEHLVLILSMLDQTDRRSATPKDWGLYRD